MKSGKKVLIITYYWPPSGGPGVQRWLKFVKYLPQFGICPIVLTVDPVKAEYPVTDKSLLQEIDPKTEVYQTNCKGVYDFYKKLTGSKTAPYSGFANEGNPTWVQKILRFVRGNLFLPDARRGWIRYAYRKACQLIEEQKTGTVITTGPPHSVHLTGLKLKAKYPNIQWIADFRDPWSNIQYKSFLYQTRWAQQKDLKYERRVLEHCDTVMFAVDERSRLVKIHPHVNPAKMVFMPNGYDASDFEGKISTRPENLVITYTGTIAANYPASGLIKALEELKTEIPVRIRFVGRVDEKTQAAFKENLDDITELVGFVEHGVSIDYLLSSSVLLLINANVEGAEFLLHGKIFEYLASGKPILLLGPVHGVAAQIIKQSGAGATFGYDDTDGIREFLKKQYTQILFHPDMDIIRQYTRKSLTRKLSEIIFASEETFNKSIT